MDPDRRIPDSRSAGSRIRTDIEDELAYHIDRRVEELIASGADPKKAREEARAIFGDLTATRRRCRNHQRRKEARIMTRRLVDGLRQDLVFAVRQLRRTPGFAAVAILTLAIGIGANSAMFSIVRSVLMSPLPYPNSDRLVRVWGFDENAEARRSTISPQDFLDWERRADGFDGFAVFSPTDVTVESPDGPQRVRAAVVSHRIFEVLGTPPTLGRGFSEEEDRPGGPAAVILGNGIWVDRFGSDPAVIGTTMRIGERPHTIVGVLPGSTRIPTVAGFDQPEVYVPVAIGPENGRGGRWLRAIGRVRDGVDLESADAEMREISAQLATEYPNSNTGQSVRVERLRETEVGNARTTLLLLFGAVALILVIACVNIANLMLARAETRQAELEVRMTLGASCGRVLRQVSTEGLVLAGLGGVLGFGIALLATRLVRAGLLVGIPRAGEVGVDVAVLLYTAIVALGATALFSVLPFALRLRNASRGSDELRGGARKRRVGKALVAVELALALPLVVCAGLVLRSFDALLSVDAGLDPASTMAMEVVLSDTRFPANADKAAFYRNLVGSIRSAPGIAAVGGVNNIPFLYDSCDGFQLPDRPEFVPGSRPCASNQLVTPGYFAALGIPLVEGREFTDGDRADAPQVIVINDVMAETFWPERSALGQQVSYNGVSREVVGVSRGVRRHGLESEATSEMFIPHAQEAWDGQMFILVRSDLGSETVARTVRDIVARLDDATPVRFFSEMSTLVSNTVAAPRTRTMLLGVFALVALGLAVVGVHGVMAFTTARRTREIGIRTALGATRSTVEGMIVRDGLMWIGSGLAVGMILAVASTRLVGSLLFRTPPLDPLVLSLAAGLLLLGAVVAGWGPAARAARQNPADVLKTND